MPELNPDAPTVFRETFPVRSFEVGPDERASVRALCNYLQEAASLHAARLGFSAAAMRAEGHAWVLTHLHVQIDRMPRWAETVTVTTWPSGTERLYATRDFVVTTDAADAPVACATSAWLVIDVERRRPTRLPAAIDDVALPDRADALPHAFDDLAVPDPGAEAPMHTASFQAGYDDLDPNGHVNNARYAAWAVEPLPDAVLAERRLRALRLQFRAEATRGDAIRAAVQPAATEDEDAAFCHRLIRPAADDAAEDGTGEDGDTLVRAETAWA
jgi:acyl-ACP thioesterase